MHSKQIFPKRAEHEKQVALAHVVFLSQQYHNTEIFPVHYQAFEEFVDPKYQVHLKGAQLHWLGCNNRWTHSQNNSEMGKSRLFWINDHDIYFELLGEELARPIKAKYQAAKKKRQIKVDNLINKKLSGQMQTNAKALRMIFNTFTSKKFLKENIHNLSRTDVYYLKALALHGMFLTHKLDRLYSSVHNIPSTLRTKLFKLAGFDNFFDMISANPKLLSLTFNDDSFLDYLRTNDIYSEIGKEESVQKEVRRMRTKTSSSSPSAINISGATQTSSGSTSLYSTTISQFLVKYEETEKILTIRDIGKLAVQYLLNASNCPLIHILKPIFQRLGHENFYNKLIELKKKEKEEERKGIIVPCQALENKIMREQIASYLNSKGFKYFDVHDECVTDAPVEIFCEAVKWAATNLNINLIPEDFKHNNQQISFASNEKLPEAPEQNEPVQVPEDFLKPLDSLLELFPEHNPFQALDDFMHEIGLELNHIPEHDILEQEEHLCQR